MGNKIKNLEELNNGELKKKKEALEMVDKIFKFRLPLIPIALIFVIVSNFLFRSFSNFYLVSALIIGASLLIFPFLSFIRIWGKLLSSRAIYLIIAIEFTIENIFIFIIFFLWAPVIIYYMGGGVITILALAYIIMVISSNPIFNNKNYSYFFFYLCLLLLFIFSVLEYLNIHPIYSFYPVEHLYHPQDFKSTFFSLALTFSLFSIIQFRLENYWNMFRKQTEELELLNRELESKVQERTKELEDAKSILEIKVQARTKELKELADNLESQVKKRTQELQERVNELERFHQLTVGRELKMVELKEKIRELEEKLKQ